MSFDIQKFIQEGEIYLQQLVDEQVQESLTLDFKLPGTDQSSLFSGAGITKEGKKVIAKALSAFSNSAGGCIVIGVDCRSVEGLDCASSLVPIADFEKVKSSISSAVGDLLQPKNDQINVHSAISSSDNSAGYIVIEVPRSDRRPHRSEAASAKQYFKRSGASSYEMEHYDIEDSFRRKASPDLEVELELVEGAKLGLKWHIHFNFSLINTSDVIAEVPMLKINIPKNLQLYSRIHFLPAVHNVDFIQLNDVIKYYSNNNFIIYPGDKRLLGALVSVVNMANDLEVISVEGASGVHFDFEFMFESGARNMRMKKGAIPFRNVYMNDKPWNNKTKFSSQ